jgi:GTP-binding protein HflX
MTRSQEEESLIELAFLAETAGAKVVDTIVQNPRIVDPSTLIGSGKVHQLSRRASQLSAELVIFNEDLSPVQVKNLEREINRKVLDRSGLILDIFAGRARTKEAQIQVELAQLQYFLPRLTRYWTHLSRQEGGIGTRGPGETQLEVDRRAVRRRIANLKRELQKIELQRQVRRRARERFKKVALIGYTNVGKSSLLNVLADTHVFVEDHLFATLDATIRLMSVHNQMDILLIDTVGFIRRLPHHLVASFRSTLEETGEADLLLHVIDISHSQFEEQIGSVQAVLQELGLDKKPIMSVFNKVDLLRDTSLISSVRQRYDHAVFTSAVRGIGLESLKIVIADRLRQEEVESEVRVPMDASKTLAMIHSLSRVIDKYYEDGQVVVRFRTTPKNVNRIHFLAENIDGDTNTNR